MELARFFSAKSSAIELQMKTNEVAGLLPQGCLASMRKNMTKRRGATITKRTKKKKQLTEIKQQIEIETQTKLSLKCNIKSS